jgi:hypothetical protein
MFDAGRPSGLPASNITNQDPSPWATDGIPMVSGVDEIVGDRGSLFFDAALAPPRRCSGEFGLDNTPGMLFFDRNSAETIQFGQELGHIDVRSVRRPAVTDKEHTNSNPLSPRMGRGDVSAQGAD